MSEQAVQQKVSIERSAVSRRCQLKYSNGESPKECQNTSHWRLMPTDTAICRTCALYLANNNHAEINAAILAPMLSTGVEPVLQVIQRTGRPYFHARCYTHQSGDIPLAVLEMPTNPPCSVCGEAVFQAREKNPLGLLCIECWQVCVLSQDGKRWLCPNGHD